MGSRFVSIWFRHLTTDGFTIRNPDLGRVPFVLRTPRHGRMVITSANAMAMQMGVETGMVLADARAIIPNLQVKDEQPGLVARLLNRLALWCIRFSPTVATDPSDGLFIDATGCTHLWGGDQPYLDNLVKSLRGRGFDVRAAIADTPGVAWAVARYGNRSNCLVVEKGKGVEALLPLPAEALRLEAETAERLHKLGLHRISQFIDMPRPVLRRRFGPALLHRLDMALGHAPEMIQPVQPPEPYSERLPCLEPVVTRSGIESALEQLLTTLCLRLKQDQKGIRKAVFKGYRVDGKTEQVVIGTNRPTHNVRHLFKLFEINLSEIEPGFGIELFLLEAPETDDHIPQQKRIWETPKGLDDKSVAELLDRLSARIGITCIHRYLPDEHHWPERSVKQATSMTEQSPVSWRPGHPRPLQLLPVPERIEVTAPIPDYPPMLFRHRGKLHKITRAEGPERIEHEWWIRKGQHRDYYRVEDEHGNRYWLFRLGHYDDKNFQWFLHGYFG